MNVVCAECKGFFCRTGAVHAAPEACPMRGDFPEYESLYSTPFLKDLITESAVVEASGYCRWTRVEEIGSFASGMGFEKLGIAHGPDTEPWARSLSRHLSDQGFEVIQPTAGIMDDPGEQARLFKERGVDLQVIGGMCVAHEILFLHETDIPTVSLLARDTRLHHNPVAGIYTSRSYLKSELFGHWPEEVRPAFVGTAPEQISSVSCTAAGGPSTTPRSRLAEAMDVAHALGVRHVGISFCVGFKEEAKELTKILKANGFNVSSVCCKTGAVPKERAGISDDQKIKPGTTEMVCNPVAQAELLNRDQVQLAMVLGQCVGHDAATLGHIAVPAFCLVAKDRVLAHNTVAALRPG